MPERPIIPMGDPNALDERVFKTLEQKVLRGKPYWWLSAYECRVCRQWWLVAQEERVHDEYLLRRLDSKAVSALLERNRWPKFFLRYGAVLNIIVRAGHGILETGGGWCEPMNTLHVMIDVAKERPGISVSALARLLGLLAQDAARVAREAVRAGAKIRFDRN